MVTVRKAVLSNFPRMLQIWEAAVLETHPFLAQLDFVFFRSELQKNWLPVLALNVFVPTENIIAGFLGYRVSGRELCAGFLIISSCLIWTFLLMSMSRIRRPCAFMKNTGS